MGRWDDDDDKKRKRVNRGDMDVPASKKRKNDHTEEQWGKQDLPPPTDDPEEEEIEPEQPNFGLSGLLANEANKNEKGVVVKYVEPKNSRKPKKRWRLHVFKDETQTSVIPLHQATYHMFGRDRKVAHIPTDHPSCSSQHAVLQFRMVPLLDDIGCSTGKQIVKPYLIDLESTNGTLLNNKKIKAARYIELVLGDCIKFGFSSREYVLLFEEAAIIE